MKINQILIGLFCIGFFVTHSAGISEAGQFYTSPKLHGLISLVGAGYLGKLANDYKKQADDAYTLYKQATSTDEADKLYKKTTRYDIRSQISLAGGIVLGLNSIRLLFFEKGSDFKKDKKAKMENRKEGEEKKEFTIKDVSINLQSSLTNGEMRLTLKKTF